MDMRSRQSLSYSALSQQHQQTIENQTDEEIRARGELYGPIFGQFPAQFEMQGCPEIFDCETTDPVKLPSREWLTWKFYDSAYVNPRLRKDEGGADVSIERFLEILTKQRTHRDRNFLMFLQGDVGSGKTAFLNFLITKHGAEIFQTKNSWFVRYNVEAENQGNAKIDILSLMRSILEKAIVTVRGIVKRLKKFGHDTYDFQKIEVALEQASKAHSEGLEIELKTGLRNFVFEVSQLLGRRFILILDNLDSFFHGRDRYQFLRPINVNEDHVSTNIYKVISEFYMGASELSKLNSNIVFVLRPESYLFLERSRDVYKGPENPFRNRGNLFSLATPKWEDVVKNRLNLLEGFLGKIEPKAQSIRMCEAFSELKSALESQIDTITDFGSHEHSTMRALKSLNNQGMRDVLDFFYNHSYIVNWVGYSEKPINFGRYVTSKPIGLMAFFLGGKCRFSQLDSNFPNIFLVNAEAVDAEFQYLGAEAAEEKQDDDQQIVTTDHPHSYWLKFALLSFIRQKNRENSVVRISEILQVFCRKCDDTGNDGYSEFIVRLALGSLSERNVSNLILPDRSIVSAGRLNITNLKVNERGNYCLDNVFPKFSYLQMVADDWALPLTKRLKSKLNWDLDYGYFAAGRDYFPAAQKMIEHKAELVSELLGLLEAARTVEADAYSHVYARLDSNSVRLPYMDEWHKSVVNELRTLHRSIGFASGGIDKLETKWKSLFDDSYNDSWEVLNEIYDI